MWRLKPWEDSQFSGLGGDATKQDTGRRAGLGWAGSVEGAILTLDIPSDTAQDREGRSPKMTPSHKGGDATGEGAWRGERAAQAAHNGQGECREGKS